MEIDRKNMVLSFTFMVKCHWLIILADLNTCYIGDLDYTVNT